MSTFGASADSGGWVVVPQVVSRLCAFYVFAVAARSVSGDALGALVIATAMAAGSVALAPAIVGKPLAVLAGPERVVAAARARSFAVLSAVAVSVLLLMAGLLAEGTVRLVLLAGAVGVPASMAAEAQYWSSVFVHGRRRAGLGLSACYLVQAGAVTVAAASLPDAGVVVAPFAGMAVAAVAVMAADGLSPQGAWAWLTQHRSLWLPYVAGVGAAVALVQAVPTVLALTAGLDAASTYRAAELVFGGTNLLIGVVVQTQLTEDTSDPGRTYRRAATLLVAAAVVNGVVLLLVPVPVLAALVGPTAGRLLELVLPFTGLRAALGVASVGAVLMVRLLTARRTGGLAVLSALLSGALLVVGALWAGLVGGVLGLFVAEVVIAGYYSLMVRRGTAAATALGPA